MSWNCLLSRILMSCIIFSSIALLGASLAATSLAAFLAAASVAFLAFSCCFSCAFLFYFITAMSAFSCILKASSASLSLVFFACRSASSFLRSYRRFCAFAFTLASLTWSLYASRC